MKIIFIVLFLFLLLGILEDYLHRKNLSKIPFKIHVNGIRGKSTVTRLIAAGIRANNKAVVAKTTGSAATFIYEDGSEAFIKRAGPTNIREQIKIIRLAAKRSPEYLIIECMAIRPDLQWVCEHKLIKSNIGVITNIRLDHMDVMGNTIEEITEALSNTIPKNGILITTQSPAIGIINAKAAELGSKVIIVDPEKSVSDDCLKRFGCVIFKENIALALKVCEMLGLDCQKAIDGMVNAKADPGVLQEFAATIEGKNIKFINAFAANEATSTLMIWQRMGIKKSDGIPLIVLFNTRADRVTRSVQFANLISGELSFDKVILTGDNTKLVSRLARLRGLDPKKIIDLDAASINNIIKCVHILTPKESLVVGIGNIGGMGYQIIDYFSALKAA